MREKVIREITRMVVSHPILASALLKLRVEVVGAEELPYPAGVDPVNQVLYIREDVEDSGRDLKAVLAHEAMHILNGTMLRMGNRDRVLWNYATDLEINWMLKDMRFNIERGLYLREFHNKHAEEIYEKLRAKVDREMEEIIKEIVDLMSKESGSGSQEEGQKNGKDRKEKGGQEDNHGDGGSQEETIQRLKELHRKLRRKLGLPEDGEVTPDQDITNPEAREIARQFIVETAVSALQMVKMGIGTMPGEWERIVDQLTESKVRWQDILRDAVMAAFASDYSYRKPYKPTLLYCDAYTPSLNEYESYVFVIVDTSGSISPDDLRDFLSEVRGILEQYRVVFIACDAKVQAVVEDGDIHEILKQVKGGGGTVLAPAFKWIEEHASDKCAPVVLMTDGHNDDKVIERPSNVTKVIVLTTSKEPEGLEADVVITLERDGE